MVRYRGRRIIAAIVVDPIHPMLVPIPIGFVVGALATDPAFFGDQPSLLDAPPNGCPSLSHFSCSAHITKGRDHLKKSERL
jgi:hypothetical protein